jgi:alkylhydroperoxidase family enzyme
VSGQHEDNHVGHARIDPTDLRQRLAALAAAIAGTEDCVADTLERMAAVRPEIAEGLRARASQARQYAAIQRNRAATYTLPASRAVPVPGPSRKMSG